VPPFSLNASVVVAISPDELMCRARAQRRRRRSPMSFLTTRLSVVALTAYGQGDVAVPSRPGVFQMPKGEFPAGN